MVIYSTDNKETESEPNRPEYLLSEVSVKYRFIKKAI
jgi:hypothetical protein